MEFTKPIAMQRSTHYGNNYFSVYSNKIKRVVHLFSKMCIRDSDNTVEVLFKDDGNTIWAYYDILTIDKEPYLNLKLRTSMIRFANQRFIDIELLLDCLLYTS